MHKPHPTTPDNYPDAAAEANSYIKDAEKALQKAHAAAMHAAEIADAAGDRAASSEAHGTADALKYAAQRTASQADRLS